MDSTITLPLWLFLLGAALAASTTAAAADAPPSARLLFAPIESRYFAFSPSGERLLEVRAAPREAGAARDISDFTAPNQTIAVHELAAGTTATLDAGRAGDAVFATHWLDEDTLLWQAGAANGTRAALERVELRRGANGALGIADIVPEARRALVVGERNVGGRRLLVAQRDNHGDSLYLVDPEKPVGGQLAPKARLAGPLLGIDRWVVDGKGRVVAAEAERRRGDVRVLVPTAGGGWRGAYTARSDDHAVLELIDVDDADGMLLAISDDGIDRAALRELDPATGRFGKQRFGDGTNSVSGAMLDPVSGRISGVVVNDNELRTEHFDPRVRAMRERLRVRLGRPIVRIVAISADQRRLVVFAGGSDDPGSYQLFDATSDLTRDIGARVPGLTGTKLAASRAFTVRARDGLELHGQYTPPLGGATTRPSLVLMPHGGPFGVRDYAYFDPEVQFLATRGYGVLQLDFRGSGGYGRDFLKAGFKEWGRAMQQDLADAARWAIAQGLAQPGRICTMGSSYGGYSAVMGLLQDPDSFVCGITVSGVSDLSLLFRSEEARSDRELRAWLKDAVGDPEREREQLRRASPAFLAKGLKRPLLIAHGGEDPRAEPEHAYRLRAAVEAGGGHPDWIFFPDEGHGFRKLEHQVALMDAIAAFLDRNLGPSR